MVDLEARKYMREVLKSFSLPTTTIGDRVIIGFREDDLKEALGINQAN